MRHPDDRRSCEQSRLQDSIDGALMGKASVCCAIIHEIRSSKENKAVREIDSKARILSDQCLLCSAETANGLIVVAEPEFEYRIECWIAIAAIVGTRIQSRNRCVDTGIEYHTNRKLGSECVVGILSERSIVE